MTQCSIKDAAEILGVSQSTIRKMCNEGYIKCHWTAGGHRRFNLADIGELKGKRLKPSHSELEKQIKQLTRQLKKAGGR